MESFRWDSCFITGLDAVDDQHRRLVELINQFGDLLMQPAGASHGEMAAVLDELDRYARQHFLEEERLMVQQGVDGRHARRHRLDHATFADEVARLQRELPTTTRDAAMPLLQFLVHWLAHHILGMDQLMARQIAALQAGVAPQDAYIAEAEGRDPATTMLLRSLQGLFQQVSERNRALLELNQTLEARVAERTRALSEANQQLEDLALTDALTGLPNRRWALRRLRAEWDGADGVRPPLACIMLDADGFKAVNDTHGHAAGDAVLLALALRLREALRTDDTVCRMGGDEFLVVCADTPLPGAVQIAEKLRREVAGLRVPAGSGEWHASISAGVAARTPAMAGVDDLLKAADQALYEAKRFGRDRVVAMRDASAAPCSLD